VEEQQYEHASSSLALVGRVLDEAALMRDLARSVTCLRESLGGSGTPATSVDDGRR
jgi:hypothetical protein